MPILIPSNPQASTHQTRKPRIKTLGTVSIQ